MVSDAEYQQAKQILNDHFKISDNARYPAGWMFDQSGKITVTGDLALVNWQSQLPLRFSKVSGNFSCYAKGLKNLEGFPDEIEGDLNVSHNQLENLQGFPQQVSGSVYVGHNRLRSLEGLPNTIYNDLEIHDNPLESLDHLPQKIIGWLTLTYSPTMPLLRTISALHVSLVVPTHLKRGQQDKFHKLHEILNKYAGKGKRAMFDLQKELEDNGFEENARW